MPRPVAAARITIAALCLLVSSAGVEGRQPPPNDVKQPSVSAPPSGSYDAIYAVAKSAVLAARKARSAALVARLTPQERAERTLDAFLNAAGGITVADLNQARAKRAALAKNAEPFTIESFLLTSLADMAYGLREPELVQAARRRGIDFSQDGFADLLAGIAGLDDRGRMQAMVDALTKTSLTEEEAIWIPTRLGSFGSSTRRYASRKLAALSSTGTAANLTQLKAWLKYQPTVTPTPVKDQGATGHMDPKRGYIGPAPDRAPSLALSQVFLCLPDRENLVLTDTVTSKPVPASALALKKLTLIGQEPDTSTKYAGETQLRLRFALAGYPNPVAWKGDGDLYDLPGLHPMTDDVTVRNLCTLYQDKTIWGYGGGISVAAVTANPQASMSLVFDNDPRRGAAIVRRIFRLRSGSPFVLSIGSSPGYSGERNSRFVTREPLVVLLELPAGVPPPSASSSSFAFTGIELGADSDGNPEAMMNRLRESKQREMKPLAYYAVFADTWDFEREYSLISLEQASKKWPPKYGQSVRQHELIRGMTPEMTAWVMGFPGEYATKADLLRSPRKEWRYDDSFGSEHLVYFKNGVVSDWYRSQHP